MHALIMHEIRSKSEIMDEKTGAIITLNCLIKVNSQPHLIKSSNAFSRNVIAVSNHLKDNKRSSATPAKTDYSNIIFLKAQTCKISFRYFLPNLMSMV